MQPASMISTTCHCGAVEVRIPRAPDTITNCSCSICRRYGVLWAYFTRDEVEIAGAADAAQSYAWGDRTLRFMRCAHCGVVTHWEPIVPGRGSRMGVNARNFSPEQLGPVRIRRLDGAVTEDYIDWPYDADGHDGDPSAERHR